MSDGLLCYRCEGAHYVVRWCSEGPSVVVARSGIRGRPWIRAVRKIDAPGWHITAHKTRIDAISPR